MSTIRWGLLSTARINRRLIPSIRMSKRSILSAVASRSLETAQEYAKEWNIPTVFGSYEAMLASDAVDAVYIGLPNNLHAEWAIRALQAGKNVLCEKPFATTLDEVERVHKAAQSAGRTVTEAFMYRHHPQTLLVKDLVMQGRLGEIRAVRGAFHFHLDNPANIRLNQSLDGGSLWDVGVYPLSYSQWILDGPPKEVLGWQTKGASGVDTTFIAQMRYPNGAVAQFTSSFESPFHTYMEIIGTQGRLVISRPFTAIEESSLTLFGLEGDPENIPVPVRDLYLGEVEDMEAAVLDGAQPRISQIQVRDHIRTALALYQSARTGQVVALE